ncbi:Indoleamine 2-3-dioxygenase [Penicillium canariense]|uniref:Indoleamine 2,3-dioxygenase n=1 Tax=Penicillium canariense TaxID=189055 RepID=A0A9W9IAN4_9EURO|nr:Indoleamine 2-3-dioxygenase [Penicillium canariense]KAJ5168997.1 Indoleamine 2-3-dioxygenase [Penicillium canariense]
MIPSPEINLDDYAVSPLHGFLPNGLPLQKLPHAYYAEWENLAVRLPDLIKTGQIRGSVNALPVLTTTWLQTEPEWRRAYSILGFLTHAYIWGGEKPKDTLPPCIAKPFLKISKHLELPPCATYAALTLWNYTTTAELDITEPDHLSVLTSFTGTKDEEWFMVLSVAIEAKGARLVPLMLDAIAAAAAHDVPRLTALLCRFTDGLQDLRGTLARMCEKNAPHVFFHQLRPFLAGSKNMAAAGLPSGVFYDLGAGQGEWHQYSGGSNAQSSLIQTFDIFLGVNHSATGSLNPSGFSYIQVRHLPPRSSTIYNMQEDLDMRNYMPAPHKRFLETLSALSNVRPYVASTQADSPLKEAFNAAVLSLSSFRDTHIQIVSRYIIMPARSNAPVEQPLREKVNLATASTQVKGLSEANPTGLYGTGGTNLIPFLKQTRDTTKSATC